MIVRTKIICTLGPATNQPELLEELLEAGMNVARLNFSHGTHDSHGQTIKILKQLREKKEKPLAIMLDTKGPEIRLGKLQAPIQIKKGMKLQLVAEEIEGSLEKGVSLYPNNLFPYIQEGASVLIDDGYIRAVVSAATAHSAELEFLNSGELKSNKSLSIRSLDVSLSFMTEKDKADLKFGVEQGVDVIAASFVRYPEDIEGMRSCLTAFGGKHIPIIAKIENKLGVEHFEAIAQVADGIMIARGDLGIELSVVEVPHLQKWMAKLSREKGRLCITATQMLESMIHNVLPTRAEVSDVANAIHDGTSAVMLSGETASGKNPIEAVRIMRSVIQETEKHLDYSSFLQLNDKLGALKVSPSLEAIGLSSIQIAEKADAKAIIVYTKSGGTPIFLSKYRPKLPIIAITPNTSIYYRLAFEWGVYPMLTKKEAGRSVWRKQACMYGMDHGLLTPYDKVLVLSRGTKQATNNLTITTVNDLLAEG